MVVSEERQPALFSPGDLPDLPALVEGAKRFVHTGKIVTKNEERAAAIAQAFLETGFILPVARRFQVSPNTVKAVMDVLERAGKLDGIKERLSAKLGLLAEVSAEAAIEAVQSGKCQPNVLPINVGVAIEKKALLDGEVTSRTESVETRRLEVADIAVYLQERGLAIDVESTVVPPLPEQSKQ